MNKAARWVLSYILAMALIFCTWTAASERTSWDCPVCGRTGNVGNFCGGCGQAAPTQEPADQDKVRPDLLSVSWSAEDQEVVAVFRKNGIPGEYWLWECFDKKSEENLSGGGYPIEKENREDVIEVRQGMLDAVPGETLSIWIQVSQEDGTVLESDPLELQIPIADVPSPITVSSCKVVDLDKSALEKLYDQVATVYYDQGYDALKEAKAKYYKAAVQSEFVTSSSVTVLLISPSGMKHAFAASGTPDVKEGDYLCFNDGIASSFAFHRVPIEEGKYTLKVFDERCLIGTWYFNIMGR